MFPNCLIIGAPRSGTTSLYEYLNSHPDTYMSPVKEPDFFASPALDAVYCSDPSCERDTEELTRAKLALEAELSRYEALFEGSGAAKVRAEASAIYLAHPTAAEHIHRTIPEAKLIAVLRDPTERIYSHYVHGSRIRAEWGGQITWDEFMHAVDRALDEGCPETAESEPQIWVRSGFYSRHLARWRALFPEEQLRVYLFEDLVNDTRGLMAKIFAYLDIDPTHVLPTTEAFNASVVPRNPSLFALFTRRNPVMRFARSASPTFVRAAAMRTRNQMLASGKPATDQGLREKCLQIYRADIEQLQELLGRDLSAWLGQPAMAG